MRAQVKDADPNTVVARFEVQDTGVGIPLQQQARLFQPYIQSDNPLSRKFGGNEKI